MSYLNVDLGILLKVSYTLFYIIYSKSYNVPTHVVTHFLLIVHEVENFSCN